MKFVSVVALAGVAASSPIVTKPAGTKSIPWVVPGNYALPENVAAGESITFKCGGMEHNVWQVSKAGYDGCTASDLTTSTYWGDCDAGETVVIPASALTSGSSYFICTIGGTDEAKTGEAEGEPMTGGHCFGGQKLEVIVAGSSTPTATSHEGHTMPAATTTMAAEPTLPMEQMYDLLGDFDF